MQAQLQHRKGPRKVERQVTMMFHHSPRWSASDFRAATMTASL
jgi:hypothetical protein